MDIVVIDRIKESPMINSVKTFFCYNEMALYLETAWPMRHLLTFCPGT